MSRNIMVIRHLARRDISSTFAEILTQLRQRGLTPVDQDFPGEVELALAVGGDGTMLAAVDITRQKNIPVLGVNTGHMGFLTEVEAADTGHLVDQIAEKNYRVDARMTLDIRIDHADGRCTRDWALNEAAILRTDSAHPVQLGVGVDGRGVSTYGADGLILATPTGSTAYSFSAGGPVVWPDVEAVVLAPLAAHGLFTRPLVVSPNSVLEVTVLPNQWQSPELLCDGRRSTTVDAGSVITSTKGDRPVLLARISDTPFSGRLVHKFDLPVAGWRSATGGEAID